MGTPIKYKIEVVFVVVCDPLVGGDQSR